MNVNTKRTRIFIILMLLTTSVAVTLRSIACMNHLKNFGYFENNTLITVSGIIIFISAAVLFSYIAFADKASLKPSFSSPSTYIPTGLVGVGLVFISRALFYYADTCASMTTATPEEPNIKVIMAIATGIFAILSIVHFFLNAFLAESKTNLRAYFSLCTVLFLGLYATFLYFNNDLPINAPNKIVDQMAYLFASIFFLYETRISLGREKWRGYVSFGLIAAMLTAYSSIPALIVYFAKGKVISASIEENVLSFALFIFILARLCLTSTLPETRENRILLAISSYAERRSEEILESEKLHEEAFAVQMTIDDLLGNLEDTEHDEIGFTSGDEIEEELYASECDADSEEDSGQTKRAEEENAHTHTETSFEELMGFAPLPTEEDVQKEDIPEENSREVVIPNEDDILKEASEAGSTEKEEGTDKQ